MEIAQIVWAIFAGALSGVGYAIIGYLKEWSGNDEDFDHLKFLKVVLIGVFVGGITGCWPGMTYTQAYEFAAGVGMVAIVEKATTLIWRRYAKRRKKSNGTQRTGPE